MVELVGSHRRMYEHESAKVVRPQEKVYPARG